MFAHRRVAKALIALLVAVIPLGFVGVVVSAAAGLYALAALNALITGTITFTVARHFMGERPIEPVDERRTVLDRLFVAQKLDPIRIVVNQLVIFVVVLAVAVDGSGGLLGALVIVALSEVLWVAGVVLRYRKRDRTKNIQELTTDHS